MKVSAITYVTVPKNAQNNPINKDRRTHPINHQQVNFGNLYPYTKIHQYFNPTDFLENIKYENAEIKNIHYTIGRFDQPENFEDYFTKNNKTKEKIEKLDSMPLEDKQRLVSSFSNLTGFPDFELVSEKMENEISDGIHHLSDKYNFDVKFIGYDINNSVGRKKALPGSDCDGLFMVIDTKNSTDPWIAGKTRWHFKDVVNQRIVQTKANFLPEVLTVDFINEGLDIAEKAFFSSDFKKEDLLRFREKLNDSSNDFVKSAEFNIELAKLIPADYDTREKYYKTAMFVELVRDGKILENNFDEEFMTKVKKSPLYYFSNIIKQRGLKTQQKNKYIERNELFHFNSFPVEKQFGIVKDIMLNSLTFEPSNKENIKYFTNINKNGKNEMGNILQLYDLLANVPYRK